ncbi:MotA/TolQ/ExbB proton channel family protein [Roseisolibacter sp. H3M3-2]|uniref:MotA/TolQ/ExbB proton channel family protein n=1 Tax=Roseisolibacter sp. H3M3-2 TaxID=3031323 RepID=UPI0023DA7E47|nr:MotA/TolQ/ExbB proton channel family protein [Roseisolibacter sp. H3M3-2]MDF1506035.1 MotA/TolQ/ExbB proton channel family protein [Roseisolibacter sp. H3M3-2]
MTAAFVQDPPPLSGPGGANAPAVPSDVIGLIGAASTETKVVLVVLVVLSLISWGIMLAKWLEYSRVERAGRAFVREFEHAGSLSEAERAAGRATGSPFVDVFRRAMLFLSETRPALPGTADRSARLSGSQVEALRLVLDSESDAGRDRLARFVSWLATIGSVSPLIGLLGTVLGVISAFTGIARGGAGNLAAVAPGVAEALVATAAALAVAIPAVFGYNALANRLNRLDGELDGFGSELIALLVREERI